MQLVMMQPLAMVMELARTADRYANATTMPLTLPPTAALVPLTITISPLVPVCIALYQEIMLM